MTHDITLHWLPEALDFKVEVASFKPMAKVDAAAVTDGLHRLASTQVDYFSTLQLDRLFGLLGAPFPAVRVADAGLLPQALTTHRQLNTRRIGAVLCLVE